ncbi:MAG: hypothetical protein KF791_13680 [Verrucomicrobiae bacterium]|nr:hypothetical protein [Verrucomicrobiae bacterium]
MRFLAFCAGDVPLREALAHPAKSPLTIGMMAFLAMWARRLSWRETTRAFGVSWEAVFRSVEWTVAWGLKHRVLQGVRAIGVDEIHWGRGMLGDGFLTFGRLPEPPPTHKFC